LQRQTLQHVDATTLDASSGAVGIDGATIQDLTVNRDADSASTLWVVNVIGTSYARNIRVTGTNIGAGTMNGVYSLGATLYLAGGIDVVVDGVALNVLTGATFAGIGNRLNGSTGDTAVSGATLTLYGTILVNSTPGAGTGGVYFDNNGSLISLDGLFDLNGLADGLVLDTDGDTTISAPTDDQIDFETGAVDRMTLTDSHLLLATDVVGDADVWAFRVKNTSGATANAGDVGYIDSAGEYKTTTTANDDVAWCVVSTGGANNANIYVARRGRITVNYTGTAPSIGHYLVTSTTAGSAARQTTMRPEVFAVCLAAGAGGTVEVLLISETQFFAISNDNNIYRVDSHSDSDFVATINGAPTATTVVYNAPSAGSEDAINNTSSSELAKAVLHNTTRGTTRLISSVNTGTNTITTVSSVDSWADTDTITIESQTVTSGSAFKYIDLDLSQQSAVPVLARAILIETYGVDSGASTRTNWHPFETASGSKTQARFNPSAGQRVDSIVAIPLLERVFTYRSEASGAATKSDIFNIRGYWAASA
jgi:hypothetical protein